MEQKPNAEKFAFDQNGKLSSSEWDRLLSQLDEEIRQAEEAAARKAGWSEEVDELWFFDEEVMDDEEAEEEAEGEEEDGEEEEELPEWELDLDAF